MELFFSISLAAFFCLFIDGFFFFAGMLFNCILSNISTQCQVSQIVIHGRTHFTRATKNLSRQVHSSSFIHILWQHSWYCNHIRVWRNSYYVNVKAKLFFVLFFCLFYIYRSEYIGCFTHGEKLCSELWA